MNEKDINNNNQNFPGKEDNFSLPENYFDSFSSRLFKKLEEDEELKDYPLLVSAKRKNPFGVPSDYFDLKEDSLAYPLLLAHKASSFNVPDLFFESLIEKISDRISIEEEKEIYSTLHSYKNEDIFKIPSNYFETFIVSTEKTKVIPLYKRIKLSYKIAAAITFLISLSILFYTQENNHPLSNDCHTFACLDKKEILNSGYLLRVSDENIIDLIDDKSLNDSLFLKKDGKTQKVDMSDVSDNVDINTLTDDL